MTSAPPEAPEQIRGETLTPVSPKPLHFPSPANVPILKAQMDPTFNDTVTQTMQQPEHLPSVAQHPAPAAYPTNTEPSNAGGVSIEDTHMANGVADGGDAFSNSIQVEHNASDPVDSAHNSVPSGTDSLSSEPKPSENDQATSAVDIYPVPEHASIDVAASTAANTQPVAPQVPTFDATSSSAPKPIDTPNNTDGSVDYSALLANLSSVIASATPVDSSNAATPASAHALNFVASPASALPNNPNLPPKPPAQEKPSIHPNYVAGDDLRNYHPHVQKDAGAPTTTAATAATGASTAGAVAATYRNPTLPNLSTNTLPPPPHAYNTPLSATLPPPGSAAPTQNQRAFSPADDPDAPFDPQTQQLYDQFIQFERQNVHDGQWDKFPLGSRLFIGNLSTEKVHKRDVFRKFSKYGQLAQISLKQAYGFVQFMDAATCATALAIEQGQKLRGREMHLEVSKPAKNSRQQERNRRRSRSPDYNRGGAGGRVDRYSGSPRDRENRRSRDWRRSPSPRRDYGGKVDRYDGRRRERSPSPYGGRNRYGTPQQEDIDLPWRAPNQVPDIQIIVVDNIDQEYVRWVDNAMKSRGARVDVLMLSPRWPDEAVVRRQILEGVLAVVHLCRADRVKNKVPLRLFNRSEGNNNVTFDHYVDLDPTTAADLVLRAKQTQTHSAPAPPPPQAYPLPPQQHNAPPPNYNYNPQQPPRPPHIAPPPPANPTDISRIISSLGGPGNAAPPSNTDLSRIMAGLTNQHPGQPLSSTGLTPDVARLLGQMGQPLQAPPYSAPPPPQQHPPPPSYQGASTPTTSLPPAPPPGSMAPPTSQTSPDIQQLLANLTNYKPPT